ncbi:MAG: bifunctional oligoribonuclease/PAP phosphatase NrnA [Clostridiales bacterium]|nr:bifunctional oligoribonuclease/PAP phosphatase NrnA [Clostridiales bacterium]
MISRKVTTTISQVAKILSDKQRIALFAHTNPDGDTVGSCVALCLALRKLGKVAALFCDTDMDETLSQFTQGERFTKTFSGKYDLLVAVDCGDTNRLGEFGGMYARFSETMTIDHHGGEHFSKYNCILPYASTCQIIYELLRELGVELNKTIATSLFVGLCTDTGNFMHSSTDSACYAMAADLCKYGVDNERIARAFFKDLSLSKTKLIGRVISRIRTYYDDQIALLYVTKGDLAEFGLDFHATTGIVQYAINVDCAKIGICMTEYSPNVYKVSMRGKDFSVREICQEFGGGGHTFASACMISGFLEDVIEKIVRIVGFYL